MCSLILLRRPEADWPLLLAANRDEMATRPWRAPGRHWPHRPRVTAGLDLPGGGSWLGLNDSGVVAGLLNRWGTLGPAPGRRSRGDLVLDALAHPSAEAAAGALARALAALAYRPFNLVIADRRQAFLIALRGEEGGGESLGVEAIPDGLSMITSLERNDARDPRIRAYLPRFEAARPPRPDPDADGGGDWSGWRALLADRRMADSDDPTSAMCFLTESGFGTVSSSLIALGAPGRDSPILWRFAAGPPDKWPYAPIDLAPARPPPPADAGGAP